MKPKCVIAGFALAACSGDIPQPSAQEKFDEFIGLAESVRTGSEFEKMAISFGHECERRECITNCQSDLESADVILICRWDEKLNGAFDVVFGTVFSIVYLDEDRVVGRNIEVIYTGP